MVERVRLVGYGVCLLSGVGRCPLIVKAEGRCSLNDLAVNVPYVVAEVVGIKDGNLLSVWEVLAKGH